MTRIEKIILDISEMLEFYHKIELHKSERRKTAKKETVKESQQEANQYIHETGKSHRGVQ